MLQFLSSLLRVVDAAGPSPTECTSSIFVQYLNFNVLIQNLQYMAASKHRYTHVCNTIPLVWGSLRLAPINRAVVADNLA